jgi:glucose-1-phosphate thymidylyltransferase
MNALILAAGYATRLYPLTLNRPKPLLPVAGRPMIDHVLERMAPIGAFDRVFVVTNARFADQFEQWRAHYSGPVPRESLVVVNDGSTDDATKLGAIGDLNLVLARAQVDDDLVVIAGDNLFNTPLAGFGDRCRQVNAPVLGVYDVGSLDLIKKYSAITLDPAGRITRFEEKPQAPTSTLTGIALYFYPRAVLPLIRQYVAEGNNPDQPGRLVQWLYPRVPFYTWNVPGLWYDIGSKETLDEADRVFARARL